MNAEYPHLMGACVPLKQPNLGNQVKSLQCRCRLLKAKIQLVLFAYVEINGNDEDVLIIGATEASDSQPNIHLCENLHFVMKTGARKDHSSIGNMALGPT